MLRSLVLTPILITFGHTFAQADDGFQSLFDGKTLEGWTQKNGTATYRVEDGCVVGKTSQSGI
ncbi:MAG: family 16 glycoside hydrolase [Planctomycetota bacterium]|nr:family 16 glycoside hydrolase [Planctomycetota bacterium]